MERIADVMDTANGGPFRLAQLGDRFFKLLNLITPNEGFKNLSTMFNKAWTVTIIPRLFSVTQEAKKAVKHLDTRRQNVGAVSKVTDAAAAWGYASALVLGCFKKVSASASAFKAAEMVTFVHDVTEGQIHAEEWNNARLAARAADAGVGDVAQFHDQMVCTQRYCAMKTAKAICSIAGFVLGLSLAASGLILPGMAIVAASISLAGTILAMSAEIYKASMPFDPKYTVAQIA
jgi:hypothetical protein